MREWLIPQGAFTAKCLTKHLERFVTQPDTLPTAAEMAKTCGDRNAANVVADQVEFKSVNQTNAKAGADEAPEIAA